MVLNDYVVAYEGDCDPYTESCFVGCEDDECTEEYYYTLIEKYAPNVKAQCGTDITECDAAYECLPEDGGRCQITYCDPDVDGDETCEVLMEVDQIQESTEALEVTEEINEPVVSEDVLMQVEAEEVFDGEVEVIEESS
jgi:hypothetical protein